MTADEYKQVRLYANILQAHHLVQMTVDVAEGEKRLELIRAQKLLQDWLQRESAELENTVGG